MCEAFPSGFTAQPGESVAVLGAAFLLNVLLLPISEPCVHGETSHGHLLDERKLQGCPYLEGALVDIHIKATLDPLGLAEQDQVLKEEDMSLALPTAQPDGELVLPHQLPLLLQVHLDTGNILVRPQQDQLQATPGGTGRAGSHMAVAQVVKKRQLPVMLEGVLKREGCVALLEATSG